MYTHLDRLNEDDLEATEPVSVRIYGVLEEPLDGYVAAGIPGLAGMFGVSKLCDAKTMPALAQRALQRALDALTNSEAAYALAQNRTRQRPHNSKLVVISVKVPRAVAEASCR